MISDAYVQWCILTCDWKLVKGATAARITSTIAGERSFMVQPKQTAEDVHHMNHRYKADLLCPCVQCKYS